MSVFYECVMSRLLSVEWYVRHTDKRNMLQKTRTKDCNKMINYLLRDFFLHT